MAFGRSCVLRATAAQIVVGVPSTMLLFAYVGHVSPFTHHVRGLRAAEAKLNELGVPLVPTTPYTATATQITQEAKAGDEAKMRERQARLLRSEYGMHAFQAFSILSCQPRHDPAPHACTPFCRLSWWYYSTVVRPWCTSAAGADEHEVLAAVDTAKRIAVVAGAQFGGARTRGGIGTA